MRYDILEYFSIYGTALSIWVSLMGKHWSLVVPPVFAGQAGFVSITGGMVSGFSPQKP